MRAHDAGPPADDEVAALAALLEAYGADPARWPQEKRRAAEQLVARDPRARALLGEAQALDRLLDAAPGAEAGRVAALSTRILAAAALEPRFARPAEGAARQDDALRSNVVPLRRPAPAAGDTRGNGTIRPAQTPPPARVWVYRKG